MASIPAWVGARLLPLSAAFFRAGLSGAPTPCAVRVRSGSGGGATPGWCVHTRAVRELNGGAVSHRLGLIAGGGDLPFEIARAAGGRAVLALGFPGITDPRLEGVVDELVWRAPGAIEAQLRTLREAGTGEVVLAGKVEKADLIGSPLDLGLDDRALRMLAGLTDQHDAHILGAVADLLEEEGFSVLPQAALVPHLLPRPGVLGSVSPSADGRRDLATGWALAGQLALAGIGQCVVVKAGTVVAVEAVEGTDATIARAASLAGSDLVVIKRPARGHDPRFDLPVVGPGTIDVLAAAGGGLVAIEAGQTLLLDRATTVDRADRSNVAVVAVGPDGPGAGADSGGSPGPVGPVGAGRIPS